MDNQVLMEGVKTWWRRIVDPDRTVFRSVTLVTVVLGAVITTVAFGFETFTARTSELPRIRAVLDECDPSIARLYDMEVEQPLNLDIITFDAEMAFLTPDDYGYATSATFDDRCASETGAEGISIRTVNRDGSPVAAWTFNGGGQGSLTGTWALMHRPGLQMGHYTYVLYQPS